MAILRMSIDEESNLWETLASPEPAIEALTRLWPESGRCIVVQRYDGTRGGFEGFLNRLIDGRPGELTGPDCLITTLGGSAQVIIADTAGDEIPLPVRSAPGSSFVDREVTLRDGPYVVAASEQETFETTVAVLRHFVEEQLRRIAAGESADDYP